MQDQLTTTFAALADPTRRAILMRLTAGPATVNELAEPFKTTLPTISRHLKVLEEAGLVVKERTAQFRPCRLDVAPLQVADQWIDQYRQFFGERFDRLGEHLEAMRQSKGDEQ
ncbi:ArsR/SmtB family transcription factor [Devosia sp. SL43]|uniref:ArsR/SmtB family transcription factor n=1 Tax=Devosia sp. SL43 TaxID=2806348 RepID=UPI001F0116A7|nr:metalloregulator ArsR/SmtB family transcription factor [Devosia sp. SL43]UJW85987.1 winged helix-turn-helix transcriptional regulator [Devosia sp. SL43]